MVKKTFYEIDFQKYLDNFIGCIPKKKFECVRVENKIGSGTPDRHYEIKNGKVRGWIELKQVRHWTFPHKIEHFTKLQKRWLRTHGERAGFCWLLILNNETNIIYLFDHTAVDLVETWAEKEWVSNCRYWWYTDNINAIHKFISILGAN
jgi:hypothetical protein